MTTQQSTPKTIFLDALEISPAAERQAYVAAQCGGDEALRSKVEALLLHHQQLGKFLEPGPANRDAAVDQPPLTEGPSSQIGPYKLLEQIGEGGMGVVFMAEQTRPVQRRVALKIIKAGMDTREVVARFEAERQALAMMDHPNIAHVLDAGATDTGRPYFVMELVRGVPMTEFCNQQSLSIRERLELFVTVCQAIQHAHQKGIIHRDIKPTNVLVTLHDGRPVIKVIDFGVAKATGQKLTDKTLFTAFTQMIGTPLYMSPEQAEMSGLDVDTRSDIFSAGVLLYELLTGTTPFDSQRLKSAAFDELRRIIREEEPPRPSTRLTTIAAEAASTVGTQRKSDPRQLSRLFRGELDWIVMKCLEKDRTRRYETASALAGDVERYLHDEPVQACPPSTRYRFGKFARRNKAALLTAAVVMLALIGGIAGAIWGMVRADRALSAEAQQRQRAYEQSELALKTLKLVVNDIQSKLAGVPGAQEVRRDVLNTAIDGLRKVARNLNTTTDADLATVQSRLDLADIFLSAGDSKGGATEECREQYESAHKIALKLANDDPDNVRVNRALARSFHGLGEVNQWRSGNARAALDAFQNELRICLKLADDDPRNAEIQDDLVRCYNRLGDVYLLELDNIGAASDAYEKFFEICQKMAHDDPSDAKLQKSLAKAYFKQGDVKLKRSNARAARDDYQKSLEITKKFAELSPHDAKAQEQLGMSYQRLGAAFDELGDMRAALDAFKNDLEISKKLAQDDPHNLKAQQGLALSQENWGYLNLKMRNAPAARAAYEESLKISQATAETDPKNAESQHFLFRAYDKLADMHDQLGDLSAARGACEKGLEISRKLARDYPKYPDAQRDLVFGLNRLGDLELKLGNLVASQDAYEKELEINRRRIQEEPRNSENRFNMAAFYLKLGFVKQKLGDVVSAHEASRKGLELFQELAQEDPHNPNVNCNIAMSYLLLGEASKESGDLQAAREDCQKGLEILQKLAQDNPKNARVRQLAATAHGDLAEVNLQLGDMPSARRACQKGLEINQKRAQDDPKNVEAQTDLADCFGQLGHLEQSAEDFPASVRWFEHGIAILEKHGKDGVIADLPDYQASIQEQKQAMTVCRAAPQAIDSLEFALAQPKEIVPELLGVRARALARRGMTQEAAATADKLASLELADGRDLFLAAVGFALCADGERTARRPAKPSTDDKALEDHYAARAVELLKHAQANGYFKDPVHRAALLTNSNLKVLHPRDDFQRLLAKADPNTPTLITDPQRGK